MIIELRGVEFVNKGAELMLHAIVKRVKQEYPDCFFVMEWTPRTPYSKLRSNNIFVKSNIVKRGISVKGVIEGFPSALLRLFGVIKEKDINVVLDGSGFAFGDQWGADKAGARSADHITKWKKDGKTVILLPQAFGPFTKTDLIDKMRVIVENADLVVARDEISYQHLQGVQRSKNVRLMPDFTNLISGYFPDKLSEYRGKVAIIPNYKMIEVTDTKTAEAYPAFLKRVIEAVLKQGHTPFFLIHEAKMDNSIAEEVNSMLDNQISILRVDDPLVVKGIIGASYAVITSRFHGLVSALSQSVPCLATGWSHKYEMLLKDYNFSDALLSVDSSAPEIDLKVSMILNAESRSAILSNLSAKALEQKELTRGMWQEVFHTINSK